MSGVAMSEQPEMPLRVTHIKEDFAGFPNESSEPFYYVREYPYASLFVIAAAVGGIIYYNRAHVRKKVGQLLHLLQGEVDDEEKEKPAV